MNWEAEETEVPGLKSADAEPKAFDLMKVRPWKLQLKNFCLQTAS